MRRGDLGYETVDGADCFYNRETGEKVEMVIAPMDGLSIATEQITMDQSMASTPISSYI